MKRCIQTRVPAGRVTYAKDVPGLWMMLPCHGIANTLASGSSKLPISLLSVVTIAIFTYNQTASA